MLSQVKDHQIKQLAEVHARALLQQSNKEVALLQAQAQLKQATENKEKYNSISVNSMFHHFEKRQQYWVFIVNYLEEQ